MPELTVEDMVGVIVDTIDDNTHCPDNEPDLNPYCTGKLDSCRLCWLKYSTPAEIRKRYAEMEGGE